MLRLKYGAGLLLAHAVCKIRKFKIRKFIEFSDTGLLFVFSLLFLHKYKFHKYKLPTNTKSLAYLYTDLRLAQ